MKSVSRRFVDSLGYDINNGSGIDEFIEDLELLRLTNMQDIHREQYNFSDQYLGVKKISSENENTTIAHYRFGNGVIIKQASKVFLNAFSKRVENSIAHVAIKALRKRRKRIDK